MLAVRDVLAASGTPSPLGDETALRGRASELRVKQMGSDTWTSLDVSRQPSGVTNVVFMTKDDMTYLTRAVSRIGGTSRRQPGFIMEVPNQPIGDAQTIIRWWNEFFPARPGHWAGFDIMTSPYFSSINSRTRNVRARSSRSSPAMPVTM